MSRLIMLDSGAYTAHTKGVEINLKDYIKFCIDHPEVSYYVNLDVLSPWSNHATPPDVLERCAKEGWKNYLKMIDYLPQEKVIHVYHQGEDVKWLEKLLESGASYIGISGTSNNKNVLIPWFNSLKKYVLNSKGDPIVRMHGFGITSFDLVKYWKWHSVDSTGWVQVSGYGCFYVPQRGVDYTKMPVRFSASPRSKFSKTLGCDAHIENSSPTVRKRVLEYLESIGSSVGKYEIVPVAEKYKPVSELESWYDKKKRLITRQIERGVSSSYLERCRVNTMYMRKSLEAMVENMYFAGGVYTALSKDLVAFEKTLTKRLFSYYYSLGDGAGGKMLRKHLKWSRKEVVD